MSAKMQEAILQCRRQGMCKTNEAVERLINQSNKNWARWVQLRKELAHAFLGSKQWQTALISKKSPKQHKKYIAKMLIFALKKIRGPVSYGHLDRIKGYVERVKSGDLPALREAPAGSSIREGMELNAAQGYYRWANDGTEPPDDETALREWASASGRSKLEYQQSKAGNYNPESTQIKQILNGSWRFPTTWEVSSYNRVILPVLNILAEMPSDINYQDIRKAVKIVSAANKNSTVNAIKSEVSRPGFVDAKPNISSGAAKARFNENIKEYQQLYHEPTKIVVVGQLAKLLEKLRMKYPRSVTPQDTIKFEDRLGNIDVRSAKRSLGIKAKATKRKGAKRGRSRSPKRGKSRSRSPKTEKRAAAKNVSYAADL